MSRQLLLVLLLGALALAGLTFVALRGPGGPGLDPEREEETGGGGRGEPRPGGPDAVPPEPEVPVSERAESILRDYLGALLGGNDEPDPESWEELANDEDGVAALLERLAASGADGDEKVSILLLLGMSRLPLALETLASATRGDYGAELRTAAIHALAREHGAEALPILERVAIHEEDDAVACVALRVVATEQPDAAIKLYARVLEVSSDPDRRKTVYALMAGRIAEARVDEPGLVTKLRRELPPPPPAMSIGDPESDAALRALVAQAAAETDPALVVAAGEALSAIPGAPAARKAFRDLLGGSEDDVKGRLLGTVDPGRSPELYGDLVRGAGGMRNREHRKQLAARLTGVTDPKLAPALAAWLETETDPEIRSALTGTVDRLR